MSDQEAEQSAPPVGESDHDVLVAMRDLLNEMVELLRVLRAPAGEGGGG